MGKRATAQTFDCDTPWHRNFSAVRSLFGKAVEKHDFIRVAILLHVRDEEVDRPNHLIFRRGREVTDEHLLFGGCGLPRGKMDFDDLRYVAEHPKEILTIARKTATNELLEEVGLREKEVDYIGPGPLLFYERDYMIDHYPRWKFAGLKYPLPIGAPHSYRNEPCYPVHCRASLTLVCSTDREVFLHRENRHPEDRIIGILDIRNASEREMIRSRHLKVVEMYRESLRNGSDPDGVIHLDEE